MKEREKNRLLLNLKMQEECPQRDFSPSDWQVIRQLLDEVNQFAGTDYNTFAELTFWNIHGTGPIFAKYIWRIHSEMVRMELLSQLVADKVKDCGELLLQLYTHYKQSEEYPRNRVYREEAYDNAFWRLKSKKIKTELITLAHNPRDAYSLPLTMRMLASWKSSEIKNQLIQYVNGEDLSEVKQYENSSDIMRELKILGLQGLRYYPTNETVKILEPYLCDEDAVFQRCANESLNFINKVSSK